jgi:uncharacterized protein YacL
LIVRIINVIAFGVLGWRIGLLTPWVSAGADSYLPWGLTFTLGGAVLGGLFGPFLTLALLRKAAEATGRIPSSAIISGALGLIAGLAVAALISIPLFKVEGWLGWVLPLALSGVLGLIGLALGLQREREFRGIMPPSGATAAGPSAGSGRANGRILVDTSAIIDGRVADVTKTGFIRGTLLIPRFVLDELRHIADSSDPLRRTRGRRGLEVLSRLSREGQLPIQVLETKDINGGEVDSELVHLAKKLKAHILTTDYNLNRVAELQGISVLNVNELANALKPVVLPGEELSINIVQEGKEPGQGVAFLDDGTMVVVEGGRRFINTIQQVTVTRVLQTAAGRIIFAQPRSAY